MAAQSEKYNFDFKNGKPFAQQENDDGDKCQLTGEAEIKTKETQGGSFRWTCFKYPRNSGMRLQERIMEGARIDTDQGWELSAPILSKRCRRF